MDPLKQNLGLDPDERPMRGHSVAEIRIPPSSPSLWAAALEGLVSMNEQLLVAGNFPPLYDAGVIYKIEKKEAFRNVPEVFSHGWGDCDDLAGWRVAELHVTGEDPGAWADVYRTGPKRLHAIVARSDGRIEDPSLILGMRVRPERRAHMPKTIEDLGGYDDEDDYGYGGDEGDEGAEPEAPQQGPPGPPRGEHWMKSAALHAPRHVFKRARGLYRAGKGLHSLHKKISKYSPSAWVGRKLKLWGEPEPWQIGIEAPARTDKVTLSLAEVQGAHGATLRIPAANGKTIVMRSTPSRTATEATTKAINLARLAARTPEMVANATPAARAALQHLTQPGAVEALTAVRSQETTTAAGFPRPPFPRRMRRRGRFAGR